MMADEFKNDERPIVFTLGLMIGLVIGMTGFAISNVVKPHPVQAIAWEYCGKKFPHDTYITKVRGKCVDDFIENLTTDLTHNRLESEYSE